MKILTEEELRFLFLEVFDDSKVCDEDREVYQIRGQHKMGIPENPFDDPAEIERVVKSTIIAE